MKQGYWILVTLVLAACGGDKGHKNGHPRFERPTVEDNGAKISFHDSTNVSFIKSAHVGDYSLASEVTFPARIAATSIASQEGAERNIILFEDPELTSNYMSLIQHLININQIKNVNIRQKTIELDRVKDLAANGAASGRDVLEAETALSMENANLGNQRASLIEHEAKLKQAGFDPSALVNAAAGMSWVVCEVPEAIVSTINQHDPCVITFISFPDRPFKGVIEAIGDVVNRNTRMVKLRVAIKNPDAHLKAGMFGSIAFDQSISRAISVPKQAVITVQGRTYIFIKKDLLTYERREIKISTLVGERAIVTSGMAGDETIVVDGTMQLKGLSFGY